MRSYEEELESEFERFEYEGAEVLSPIDFAKLMGMRPQMVYYYIRNGVIETEMCRCGKRVVNVEAAKAALEARRKEK